MGLQPPHEAAQYRRFPQFPQLPPEIRQQIWHFASPEVISIHIVDGIIVSAKPHPFLATCRESRHFYQRDADKLESEGLATAVSVRSRYDFVKITGYLFCIPRLGRREDAEGLHRLRRVMISGPVNSDVELLLDVMPQLLELRVLLGDSSGHHQVAAASQFHRIFPTNVCEVGMRPGPSGVVTELCATCAWVSGFERAGFFDVMYQQRFLMTVDSSLSTRPSVDEIRSARNPMVRFVRNPRCTSLSDLEYLGFKTPQELAADIGLPGLMEEDSDDELPRLA